MKFRFNKHILKLFFIMAVPLALQNLISVSVNLIDNLMIGALGDTAIAAVNSANQFFFVYNLLVFGTVSGSGVFLAQFWGKRDLTGIRKTLGLCILIAMPLGILFGIAAFFAPGAIMHIFSRDLAVIELGIKYLKIVAFTYPLTAATLIAASLVKSVEKVKIPLVASVAAIGFNAVFNYLLIFGKFGFPKLGVEGAAYATLLARAVEFLIIYVLTLREVGFLREKLSDYFSFSGAFVKQFIKTSLPVILNEGLWSIGVSVYFIIYARTGNSPREGTAAVAAVNISSLAEKLSSVFAFGMANAVAVIIGKEIGIGRRKKAFFGAAQFCVLAFLSGLLFGAVMIAAAPAFISCFAVSPEAASHAKILITILGAALAIKNYNLIVIVGIFRGGGDTVFSCLLDVLGVWAVGIPCAFITGMVLKLPLPIVFASTLIEEIIKFVLGTIRIRNKKWLHDLVN